MITRRHRHSALLRRLHHEAAELRRDLRTLALGTLRFDPLALRDAHGELERLTALQAEELVARHGRLLVAPVPTASVDTRKPASRGRVKTGQWESGPKHECCTAVPRD